MHHGPSKSRPNLPFTVHDKSFRNPLDAYFKLPTKAVDQHPRVPSRMPFFQTFNRTIFEFLDRQAKSIGSSQPAFKPRKLKKSTESQYRDRAAERRVGEGNDYAQVSQLFLLSSMSCH